MTAGRLLRPAGLTGALALAGLAALGTATAAAALFPVWARAWLLLFFVGSGVPVGALVLLMIARLTGGRWEARWRPILAPLAAATPLAALAFLPVAAALPGIYPWAADPGAAAPDVARLYLNAPFFLGRGAVALGGWSVLGLLFGLSRPSALVAAGGLVFHGLAVSWAAVDWFLSVEPGFVSSNWGALVAVGQIGTALGLLALIGGDGVGERGDLGALLVATQVGVAYLALMAFVVAWYGDLPAVIGWYVRRAEGGSLALAGAAVACFVATFLLLLRRPWRRGGPALRAAGAGAVAAIALHHAWVLGPAIGGDAVLVAGLAAALLAGGIGWVARRSREAGHAA